MARRAAALDDAWLDDGVDDGVALRSVCASGIVAAIPFVALSSLRSRIAGGYQRLCAWRVRYVRQQLTLTSMA
jgi:hypothetical protein